jgi:hypothetical protein
MARKSAGQAALPGLEDTGGRLPTGPTERAAGRDLTALRAQDAVLPDAAAVEVLYRRLARVVDMAARADELYTVAFAGHRLIECHAYLTGARPEPLPDVDPFTLSTAVVDPTFS